MKPSIDQILTTRGGSRALARPLLETMRENEHRRPYDRKLFDRRVFEAVGGSVRRPAATGLELVTDGEHGKSSFSTDVVEPRDGSSSRASFAPQVHPTVVWEKFGILDGGARNATERLWP